MILLEVHDENNLTYSQNYLSKDNKVVFGYRFVAEYKPRKNRIVSTFECHLLDQVKDNGKVFSDSDEYDRSVPAYDLKTLKEELDVEDKDPLIRNFKHFIRLVKEDAFERFPQEEEE